MDTYLVPAAFEADSLICSYPTKGPVELECVLARDVLTGCSAEFRTLFHDPR